MREFRRKRKSEPTIEPTETEKNVSPEPEQKVNGFEVKPSPEEKDGTVGTIPVRFKDGKVDEGVREKTWQKLGDVLRATPGALEKLGLARTEKGKSELIKPDMLEPVYTGIGLLNTFVAIRLFGYDSQVAQRIIPYTSKSELGPGETEILAAATADAFNENIDKLPKWLIDLLLSGGNVALTKLAMVLFQIHAQKIAALRAVSASSAENTQQAIVN